ncbi:MAG: hypothetical protein KDA80_08835, partial [Planctomycetaceae bacterium]|nr:hypothetical protein [Planctomycetaceae bacterium]
MNRLKLAVWGVAWMGIATAPLFAQPQTPGSAAPPPSAPTQPPPPPPPGNSGTTGPGATTNALIFDPAGAWSMGPANQPQFNANFGSRVKVVMTLTGFNMSDTRQVVSSYIPKPGQANVYSLSLSVNARGEVIQQADPNITIAVTGLDTMELRYGTVVHTFKRVGPSESLVAKKNEVMEVLKASRASGGLNEATFHNELSASADRHCLFLASVQFDQTGNPLDAHWEGKSRFDEIETRLKGLGYQLDSQFRHSETVFAVDRGKAGAVKEMVDRMRDSAQHWNNLMPPGKTVYVLGG